MLGQIFLCFGFINWNSSVGYYGSGCYNGNGIKITIQKDLIHFTGNVDFCLDLLVQLRQNFDS